MRSRLLPLLVLELLLLCVAFLAIEVRAVLVPRSTGTLSRFWDESAEPLSVLLLLPLFVLAVVFVGLWCRDSGPHALSKGELDCLIRRKHQGALMHRSRRIRESAARITHYIPSSSRFRETGFVPPTDPDAVLDRLVQRKRLGAWAPRLL